MTNKKHSIPRNLDPSNPAVSDPLAPTLSEPIITVGILDRQTKVKGRFEGNYQEENLGQTTGTFVARVESKAIALTVDHPAGIVRAPSIHFFADHESSFLVQNVTIGVDFHWERKEEQAFRGNLVLRLRDDGTLAVINEIGLEDYLESVISSEMNSEAPVELLKAHAILSRSWLLSALELKKAARTEAKTGGRITEKEVIRWHDREDHDLFDVCADDHCQRYQGITKVISSRAGEAVRITSGITITWEGKICDTRYSKACGGLTESFETAWNDSPVPYLISISDSPLPCSPVKSEEEAARWILSAPPAYCNIDDTRILKKILPAFDQETKDFFRWTVQYEREELEHILKDKSGFDFGTLQAIIPLQRGPSGRICRLKIVGSKKSIIVGKELEIRRWLSRNHLYSSAFIVEADYDATGKPKRFQFHGAGWGHGVGLCQIGAAVMAYRGFSAKEILNHYFPGTELSKIY